MELGCLKNLRDSITRGGKILEAELEWLTEKLVGLEERLKESTMTVMVMEEEFCRMWAEKYSEELIQKVDEKLDDADDEGRTSWSILVESPPTIRSRTAGGVLGNPTVETADGWLIAPIPRRNEDSIFRPIPHIKLSSYAKEGHPAPTSETNFTKPNVVLPKGLEEFEQAIANF